MPLQATSGAASQDAFGGNGVAVVPTYIEEVFSTYLYTGTGASQTITNGIDLSTKGGMVWCKERGTASDHVLTDSTSSSSYLRSNGTNVLVAGGDITGFTSSGFTLANNTGDVNVNNSTNVSWTFRKQPKFFDVVTFTAGTSSNRRISHSLGSAPGMILLKANESRNWYVYHRSLGRNAGAYLNLTNAAFTSANTWGTSDPTATDFGFDEAGWATSGVTQTAYLFAHDAGGFGLTGTDNVISCGSFTADGSGNATVNLGFEPQWVMIKRTDSTGNWFMLDVMRQMSVTDSALLRSNLSNAEALNGNALVTPTATGFNIVASVSASSTHIYIAIRRGPMKVPTTGTSVFSPVARSGTGGTATITAGFAPDSIWSKMRNSAQDDGGFDKLRGAVNLRKTSTGAEYAAANAVTAYTNTGVTVGADSDTGAINSSGSTYGNWIFQRAPSFMDVVCYTGDGTANRQLNHNLTVTPELIIAKRRSAAQDWVVFGSAVGSNKYLILNTTAASDSATIYTSTSTTFGAQANLSYNTSAATYVAYLFATCAGVSKCTSFTGNGTSQTINCGFTSGARFVMIKATSTTGNWTVFDSARGISAGGDPALYLNSTAAEVTGIDAIDADSTGFIVNQEGTFNLNSSGVQYLVLAIA